MMFLFLLKFFVVVLFQLLIMEARVYARKLFVFRTSSSPWWVKDVDPYHSRGTETFGGRSKEYSGTMIFSTDIFDSQHSPVVKCLSWRFN